jgi:hypothetical protein
MSEVDESDKGAPGTEASRIHNLVKQAANQEGFGLFELKFGKDSRGADAVWISFILSTS